MSAPELSVITRTRGRRLLLDRAARSVAASAPEGTQWVVVCDDPDPSIEVPQPAGLRVDVVRTGGVGRPGALNAGLDAASGAFVHIHDDDDTVEPRYHDRTLSFLRREARYGAVVTWVERRTEAVEGDAIRPLGAVPHNPGLRTVTFAQLASACLFPPIAFVARREAMVETGRFDPELDVAEDYDFFLRFLGRFDIGVIQERLAAVHVRPSAPDDMANSRASAGYEEVDALYRNARLRRDLARGEMGLGWVLLIGELAKGTSRLDRIVDALGRSRAAGPLRRLLR